VESVRGKRSLVVLVREHRALVVPVHGERALVELPLLSLRVLLAETDRSTPPTSSFIIILIVTIFTHSTVQTVGSDVVLETKVSVSRPLEKNYPGLKTKSLVFDKEVLKFLRFFLLAVTNRYVDNENRETKMT